MIETINQTINPPPQTSFFENIPSELIADILVMAIHAVPSSSVINATRVIMRVCRLFHQIALCTPALWVRIGLGRQAYSKNRVMLWLERSKGCPLYLDVFFSHWNSSHDLEFPVGTERLGLLLPHAHRWRSLELRADNDPDVRTALALLPAELNSLTSISLHCWVNGPARRPHIFNPRCPSLKSVDVRGLSLDWSSWAHLHGIEHLAIGSPGFSPREGENVMEIHLPSLTHLEVTDITDLDYLVTHLLSHSPNLTSVLSEKWGFQYIMYI